MEATWEKVSEVLREKIGGQNVDTWFQPARFRGVNDRCAVLQLPNKFFVDWIHENHYDALLESFRSICGDVSQVVLHASAGEQGELFLKPTGRDGALATPAAAPPARRSNLMPHYTFDNFVVGASNQFAHAAALAVANQPGELYNPIFIYGGVGLGKTHLINAIGHRVLGERPQLKIGYFSAEGFMNELIAAIRQSGDRMEDFKNRFRKLDVLILDDVHVLAGRERTQEEFFHTFNVLHDSRRQIVLTSDKTPKDIRDLEARLRNRFEWGLIADIQAPDIETRIAILLKKADLENLELPHDVAIFLASKFEANIRELEGALTRLGAFASLARKPITVEFAREVLKELLHEHRVQVSIELVQKVVCDQYGVRPLDIRSAKRTKNLAFARQVAMYLSRKLAAASLATVGQRFGNRDHSTVLHGIQVIETRLRSDPAFQNHLARLERLIQGEVRA
ncbi:MAG: chromosomal replication initiator protein [Candidatus Binatota bacterium]|nr:chromosomal replication initiator protein [Candidatus Binatota bacterium]